MKYAIFAGIVYYVCGLAYAAWQISGHMSSSLKRARLKNIREDTPGGRIDFLALVAVSTLLFGVLWLPFVIHQAYKEGTS